MSLCLEANLTIRALLAPRYNTFFTQGPKGPSHGTSKLYKTNMKINLSQIRHRTNHYNFSVIEYLDCCFS